MLYRLKLPSVLILYQDITVSVFGALILIGFMDRRLFCVSENLIKSYTSSSHFCTFSGKIAVAMCIAN